jgi:DNA polymerase III, alpha subunit
MEGVSSVNALCEAAKAHGATRLALTDTNGLYGAIRFLQAARDARLAPILGAELVNGPHRAVILTKTPEGYANLCRLLSSRHGDASFNYIEAVCQYRAGLILITDDEHALTAWAHASPEDLYVELTPGPTMHQALAFSRRTGLPPVATSRARFVKPDDVAVHRLLRAIALNTTLSRLPPESCCASTHCHWLMPPALMEQQYPHVPAALENTLRIADACHTEWNFGKTIFPAFRRLPDTEAFALLREKTHQGAQQRYGSMQRTFERELSKN